MEKVNIIITGGLGHIGSWLVSSLGHIANFDVTIIDDLSTQRYGSLRGLPFNTKFIEDDFTKRPDIIKDAHVIIHLAAFNEALKSQSCRDEFTLNNITKLQQLLEQISPSQSFIFPSTTSIYSSYDGEITETLNTIQPQSYYAETKQLGEEMIRHATKNHYILRLGTIFGVSRGMRFHTAINKFCLQAHLGEPLTVWEEYLDHARPYLGLTDFTITIRSILRNKVPADTYNLVSENRKLSEIIDLVQKIYYKKNVKINLVDSPLGQQKSYVVNCDKIKKFIGKTTDLIEEGIKQTMYYLDG